MVQVRKTGFCPHEVLPHRFQTHARKDRDNKEQNKQTTTCNPEQTETSLMSVTMSAKFYYLLWGVPRVKGGSALSRTSFNQELFLLRTYYVSGTVPDTLIQ